MKKILKSSLTILLLACLLISCESKNISEGRKAYKKYLNKVLKDPSSLKIYSELITSDQSLDNSTSATFVIDYGSKNSYGAMTRETVTIHTFGSGLVMVDNQMIKIK
jgi:hypothetical protein